MRKCVYKKVYVCMITAVLLVSMVIMPVSAVGKKVRIGYYPLENYHAVKDGEVYGYEVEYLNKLTEITGWNIDYIELKNWNDGLEKLRNKEIDMLSPAQITEDRLNDFIFSAMPLGKVSGAIMTSLDSNVVFEDFEKFSDMTFGIEKDVTYNELFHTYATHNHFDEHVLVYDSHDEMVNALNEKKIDGIVGNIMRLDNDSMKLLGRFGMTGYYFMLNNNDTALLKELNNAMSQLQGRYPNLIEELIEKYFPVFKGDPLTKKELDYIKQIDSLKVGCAPYPDPLLYKEDGEIKGITVDILNLVSQNIGIPFEYVELPRGKISYDDIKKSGIDLIASVEYNSTNAQLSDIMLTEPYIEADKLLVGISGKKFDPNAKTVVGICSGSETLERVLQKKYPAFTIERYNDVEDCLDALLDGKLGLVLQNEYSLKRILNKPKYDNLSIIAKAGIGDAHSLSPVIYEDDNLLNDSLLISILNKGIESIEKDQRDMIVIDKTIERTYQYTFSDTLYVYRYVFIFIGLLLGVIGGLMIYTLKMRTKNILLLKKDRRELMNERDILEEMAQKDLLTGVLNKMTFIEKCQEYFDNHSQEYCGLLFIDLDNFKAINDTYGHMDGDWVLIRVSMIMSDVFDENAYISRFGGDEFCLMLMGISYKEMDDKINEFLSSLNDNNENEKIDIYASVGAVYFKAQDCSFDEVLGIADKTLYEVKNKQKNGYKIVRKNME